MTEVFGMTEVKDSGASRPQRELARHLEATPLMQSIWPPGDWAIRTWNNTVMRPFADWDHWIVADADDLSMLIRREAPSGHIPTGFPRHFNRVGGGYLSRWATENAGGRDRTKPVFSRAKG